MKVSGAGKELQVTGIRIDGAEGFGFTVDKTAGAGAIGFNVQGVKLTANRGSG